MDISNVYRHEIYEFDLVERLSLSLSLGATICSQLKYGSCVWAAKKELEIDSDFVCGYVEQFKTQGFVVFDLSMADDVGFVRASTQLYSAVIFVV